MNDSLKKNLIELASKEYSRHNPTHDLDHVLRVLRNAEEIAATEPKCDRDILVPAALFHDLVNYLKNDPRRKHSASESAKKTKKLLLKMDSFPKDKIEGVTQAIKTCSFFNGKPATSLEGKILQDADGLEATGAIEIMRTFSYSGTINRKFYDPNDPFAENRDLNDLLYALDHFFTRSFILPNKMNTKFAKQKAKKRISFMKMFIKELKLEIYSIS